MKVRARFLLLSVAALLPAGSIAGAASDPLSAAIEQARREQAAAEAQAHRFDELSRKARDTARKLAAERQAAAAELQAAEARLSVAQVELAQRRADIARAEQAMARRQAPVAALVGGIVNISRRPPLLTIAEGRSAEELVRVSALLDSAMPEMERRSAALVRQIERRQALEREALAARDRIVAAREDLAQRQRRFASLESKANQSAVQAGGQALAASDQLVMAREDERLLTGESGRRDDARALARSLEALRTLPAKPGPAPRQSRPDFAYRLPVEARLIRGMGEVDSDGVSARGVEFATARGAPVLMPADGTIAFAGPFRRHDGVIIIDHGGGWMTMLLGVRSDHGRNDTLKAGEPLGRALGPVSVELTFDGRPVSAAQAAARSLSIKASRG